MENEINNQVFSLKTGARMTKIAFSSFLCLKAASVIFTLRIYEACLILGIVNVGTQWLQRLYNNGFSFFFTIHQ